MIRVLQVVPNMHRAGLETFIMNVYRCIDRNLVQFDFLVHYNQRFDYDDEIERLGGKIYRFPVREDNDFFKYIGDLNRFFDEHKEYQIVHGHMESFGFLYSSVAKKHGVKTIIAHSHNAFVEPTLKGFLKNILNKFWTGNVNHLFACSNKAGEFMFGKKDFIVVNNGINVSNFKYDESARRKIREEFNLKDETIIGHIGRFDKQKNHNFLVDIFSAYVKKNPNAVLFLVGTGEYVDKVKQHVEELKLSKKVYFLGVREDTNSLYSAFDLFLLPSLFEGLPVVGVEAQASGLPMIVSDVITKELEITNLVHYQSLSDNIEQWATAIDNLLNHSIDRSSYNSLVAEGGFDINSVTKFLTEFYLKNGELYENSNI